MYENYRHLEIVFVCVCVCQRWFRTVETKLKPFSWHSFYNHSIIQVLKIIVDGVYTYIYYAISMPSLPYHAMSSHNNITLFCVWSISDRKDWIGICVPLFLPLLFGSILHGCCCCRRRRCVWCACTAIHT